MKVEIPKRAQLPPLIFNLYKPAGPSSFGTLGQFKRLFPKKTAGKIGHFGTLDPFADGILLVGIGGAARLNNFVHSKLNKTYRAVGVFGVRTKSGDLSDPVEENQEFVLKTEDPKELEALFHKKFLGSYFQAPHKYSAAKHEGRPLYAWAREGINIEKKEKLRHIYKFKIIKVNLPEIEFEVEVSSGTYVRSLFEEMAAELGTIGALKTLTRTKIGHISIDDCLNIEELGTSQSLNFQEIGMTPQTLLPWPCVELEDDLAKKYKNGQSLTLKLENSAAAPFQDYFWGLEDSRVLGLASYDGEILRPHINFPV